MSNVSINIDTSQWDALAEKVRMSIDEFIPRVIQEATPIIQQSMADNVPVKTGRLRASISSEIGRNYSVTSTNTGYGKFVDQPTAAHFIRPVIGQFLRFEIAGQVIYARQVYHPGTKGTFFIQKTLTDVQGRILEIAKTVWSGLVSS